MRHAWIWICCLPVTLALTQATAKETGHGDAIYRTRNEHAGNKIRVTFQNFGMMGAVKGDQSVFYAGEWPIGSGQVQMGNASTYVMSEMRIPAGYDSASQTMKYENITPVVFCQGWDPDLFSHDSLGTFLGFEPIPGYYSISQKEKDPYHAAAMSHEPFTWPLSWPDKMEDPNEPGWPAHWNGYFGKDQLNADQESYYVMDDYQYKKLLKGLPLPKPVADEPDRGGLGLRVAVRGLQWSNPDAEDCLFWLYEIRNFGEQNLTKTLFGSNVGASSGALVGENTDYNDDVARYYREKALAVNYDYDNKGTRNYSPVPWVGFAFLESPGNAFDGIDNDGDAASFGGGKMIGESDFVHLYGTGERIVMINYESERYDRTLTTMPAEGVTFTVNGTTYTKRPGSPLQELPDNLIDDNLNGLIDENDGAMTQDSVSYYLYIRSAYNNRDYLAKDYFTGNGLENPMIDERRDDGIDNDRDWDSKLDDVGLDGKPGTADTGEGDGLPTGGYGNLPGEPNTDVVDVDESDQIGLTSFKFFEYGSLTYSNDDQMWEFSRPGYFDLGSTDVGDYDYIYSCGYFPLMKGQKEFFSVALVYGLDETDILRNKDVIQRIYNSNYNFAMAPNKPKVQAVAGDQKITLYWDSGAEQSFDRYLKEFDFEGYKIYKATYHTFEDAGSISDGLGYERFKKPLAIYDKVDSVFGFFPETFGTGVQFNLGNESGLVHAWVDSPLVNGIRYYYAVTAYDKGNLSKNIGPTETTIFVNVDQSGNINMAENVVTVTPQAPALGYVPPDIDQPRLVGNGRTAGRVSVSYLEPDLLVEGQEYEIQFMDQTMDNIDNDLNGLIDAADPNELVPTETTGLILKNVTTAEALDSISIFEKRIEDGNLVQIKNLYDDRDGDPRTLTAISHGMEFHVYNPPDTIVNVPEEGIYNGIQWSQNINPETAYAINYGSYSIGGYQAATPFPRQYEIVFYNDIVKESDSLSVILAASGKPVKLAPVGVNYRVLDGQTGEELPFAVSDYTKDPNVVPKGFFSARDRIVFFEKLPNDSNLVTSYLINGVATDTAFVRNHGGRMGAGDTLKLISDFHFTSQTRYQFTVHGQKTDTATAKATLNRIKAVPNPYVVTALWEPHNPYTSGRGPRVIQFIHLPQRCTIRIYAVDGTLVRTLEHDDSMTDGAETWDLMTKENMDIAYGIYLYHVDAPGIGEHVGRLLIIK